MLDRSRPSERFSISSTCRALELQIYVCRYPALANYSYSDLGTMFVGRTPYSRHGHSDAAHAHHYETKKWSISTLSNGDIGIKQSDK